MSLDIPPRPEKPKHPYPGLRPFEPAEWPIFFGRDSMVDDVIDRLARPERMVFVHGSSGSGKSSLVRAGVLPRLARQERRQGGSWRGAVMRPSGGPLWNLAHAFAGLEGRDNDLDRIEDLARRCNARDATLSSLAQTLDGMAGQRLCLLVDQFEEIFRFAKETSREEAEVFVALLTREIAQQSGAAHVIVTMRSEFLGDCARFAGFADTINRTQYLVPRMARDGLVRAIERPAQLYGGEAAPGLADRLIAEARGEDDELPLTQHALMLIWNEAAARTPQGETIRLDARLLDEAGNLSELLSSHADRILAAAAPTPEHERVAEDLFRALTDINADGQAIRRPQKFGDLVAVCGGDAREQDARAIIDGFRAEGVSFLTPYAPEPLEAKTVVDIGHEAVIRCWRRIASPENGWLRQEFDDGLKWRSLLVEAKGFEQDRRGVLPAAAIEERAKLCSEHSPFWSRRYGGGWPLVEKLLEASRKAEARARRETWMRRGLWVAAGLCLLLLIRFESMESQTAAMERTKAEQRSKLALMLFNHITGTGQVRLEGATAQQAFLRKIKSKAENGDIGAASMLGALYQLGIGAPSDSNEARKWFEQAAAGGDATAMSSIAYFYYGDGQSLERRDYQKAREWFEKAAAAGDAIAMSALGYLYENGQGVAQDYVKAREWYERAANAGNEVAMLNIGALYANGHGVAQNYEAARKWYEKAAAEGVAIAMRNLGGLYENGQGVTQDYVQARAWYEKAAAAGEAIGMLSLGVLYDYGRGVAQDHAKAQELYEKSAATGNAQAMANLGVHYSAGQGVTRDYAKAREWYEKASALGNALAMNDLGALYDEGKGVAQDYAKAREWYEKAAAEGVAIAMRNLGDIYADGHGVAQDFLKAREWYEKAAAGGDAAAMRSIGRLYAAGHGVTQDYSKARENYERAAAGNADAINEIGVLYVNGQGVVQDYAKAREWFEKAATAGNALAMRNIGMLYAKGQGVTQDYAKAREWYEKAANAGDADSMTVLGSSYYTGQAIAQDYVKAREWFEKAAQAGHAGAMASVGVMYSLGQGGAQSDVKAREWLDKAVAAGNAGAMSYIGALYASGQGVAQDYLKAREWYEKAASAGVAVAMRGLGVLYEDGKGGAKDPVKAREWLQKAAAAGDADAVKLLASPQDSAKIRRMQSEDEEIHAAFAGGRYADAFRLQSAFVKEIEAEDVRTKGKAGEETGKALGNASWYALLARKFPLALADAERAHKLDPHNPSIEMNHAHALMFLGRNAEARLLYLSHGDETLSVSSGKPWPQVIVEDFAELRKARLTHPLMDEITAKFADKKQ